jgi:hypothetical protein
MTILTLKAQQQNKIRIFAYQYESNSIVIGVVKQTTKTA